MPLALYPTLGALRSLSGEAVGSRLALRVACAVPRASSHELPEVRVSAPQPPQFGLGVLDGLHEYDHQLSAYCPTLRCGGACYRLVSWSAGGRGTLLRLPPARVRSRECGEVGPPCHAGSLVTGHPVFGSRSLPGRTSAPVARSASGSAAYGRHGAGMSTHMYPRATSRAPCCGGRRSRSLGPSLLCSRASNSHRPDLVVSLDYPMTSRCWLTQHVPPPEPRATGRIACLTRDQTAGEGPFASIRW